MPQPYTLRSPYPVTPSPGSSTPRAARRPVAGSGSGVQRAPSQERPSGVRAVGGQHAATGRSAALHLSPPTKPRPLPPGPGPLDERGRKLEARGRAGRSSRELVVSTSSSAKRTPLRANHSLGAKAPSTTSSSSASTPPVSRRKASIGGVAQVPRPDPCAGLHEPQELQECLRRLSATRLRRSPSLSRLPARAEPAPSLKRSSSLRGLHQEAEVRGAGTGGAALRPVQLDVLPGTSKTPGGSGTPARSRTDQERLLQEQQRKQKRHEALTIGTGLIGLRNLGNTCFMNAILQCLSNTRGLREYCIHKQYQLEANGYGKRRCELMDAFASLISALWDSSVSGSINPIHFQQTFQKLVPQFAGYSQQDAQEFLRFLMDWLHVEINRKAGKTPNIMSLSGIRVSSDNMERMRDDEKSIQMWKRYLERDDSKIVDLFVGQLNSTLRCTTCGHKSTTFEVFCDLSLPLPKRMATGGRVSLADCLSLFTAEEELDTDNAPMCERCNQRKRSTKKLTIQRFPKILVLHLNRFSFSRYAIRKSTTHVEFPLYGLNLRQFSAERAGSPVYDLYAVCNHTGTVNGGHYTAYCKAGGRWHVYNDSRVSLVQENQIVSSEAYVLFYELDEMRSMR